MISDTLGAWLFTQTWQVAVLVLVVTAVAARWGRTRPHLAHALWLVVLLKCFTPPIWASPSGLFCWLRPAESPYAITAGEEPNKNWSIDNSDRSLVGQGVNSDSGLVGTIVAANSWESNATRAGASASGASWTSVIREFVMRSAVGVWLVGGLLALTLGAVRAGRFIAQLKRSSSTENAELTAAVEQLRKRLGVRRAVRVRVTRASVGPVIVGLPRPTIYLPATLVEGWNAAALEPILAHELVHQRRGDLWFCWLQWLARGLWWFHPAVAWACRCWNREVERCCDEETVAGMDYPPGRYARSLLSVLERKLELRAAPVFPGVRPLDVTTYRLERIMRLGHGSRRRAPLWCWGLMFAAALAALPGAAFVAEAKDRRRVRRP
ncbi:MAG TPA: M56 family metallopeptidase, partial [Pirellulaceae bacterium]|nr:M56 family metallopeptidase [Pirellulaceae bacterium]